MWRHDVRLARGVSAAHQRHDVRPRLFARAAQGDDVGYGEVDPQPVALNGDPGVDEVLEALRDEVGPRLGEITRREGRLPSWQRVAHLAASRPASRFAWALVEMALLDQDLRRTSRSTPLGWRDGGEVGVLATVSLLDPPPEGIRRADRLRAKLRPGTWDDATVSWLAAQATPVLLDYNGSAGSPAQVLADWDALAPRLAIVAIEQPFAPGDLASAAELAARCPVPLSVDEGVRSWQDVRLVAAHGAARLVCVKPARVGGLAVARALCHRAGAAGLRPYVGGFFESPLGRSALRLVARDAVDEPSDVGPVGVDEEAEVDEDGAGLGFRLRAVVTEGAPGFVLAW